MADVNDVLEKLVSDPEFRRELRDDPAKALEGYDLSDADRRMLTAQVSDDAGTRGGLEQRTSKSALAGLFGGGGGSSESDLEFVGRLMEHEEGDTYPTESMSLNFGKVEDGDSLEEEVAFAYKTIKVDEGETLAPVQQDPASSDDSHEIEMDVHVGRSEPEPPSDLSTGDQTEESSSGWPSKWKGPELPADPAAGDTPSSLAADGMVGDETDAGKYVVTSVQHGAASVQDSDGDLAGASVREEETGDETLKTVAASDSTSETKGDPLVGKITPKGETEQGSPTLKEAIFQNTYPGDTAPGHEEEIEVLSFNPGTAADPDQPIIAGRVYNTGDPTEEAPGIELGAMKAGSTEPQDGDDSLAQTDQAGPGSADGPQAGKSPGTGAGLRSDGELVQGDDTGHDDLAVPQPEVEEGAKGNVKAGYDLKKNEKA